MAPVRARHYPDFDKFRQLAEGVDLVPVYRRLVSDSLTPVTAFHKIDAGRCACLAESVVGGEKVGRYSFLATHPFLEIEAHGNRVTVSSHSGVSASGAPILETRQFESPDPLAELRDRVTKVRAATLAELPPFSSGAVGYAGYDVVRYVENLPNPPRTIGTSPIWLSPSTIKWSSSTTWTRRSWWWRWRAWGSRVRA